MPRRSLAIDHNEAKIENFRTDPGYAAEYLNAVPDDAKTQHRIRLSGIDAPERRQDFGNVSRQILADAVFQRRVVVEYDKTDRYGRLVSKVLLNGQDECLDRQAYAAAETEARAARRGLWRDGEPVPPWEWRHR